MHVYPAGVADVRPRCVQVFSSSIHQLKCLGKVRILFYGITLLSKSRSAVSEDAVFSKQDEVARFTASYKLLFHFQLSDFTVSAQTRENSSTFE